MWLSTKPAGRWETEQLGDYAIRYWDIACPRLPFTVLYLHDQDGTVLDEMPAVRNLVESRGCRVVCPLAGPTWWLETIGAQHGIATWVHGPVFEWMQAKWGISTQSIALFGKGMGGQGALRWGFAASERFPVVVSLQSSIAFEQLHGQGTILDRVFSSPEQCRQHTVGMFVSPRHVPKSLAIIAHRADPVWYRGNDRLHEKLRALGVEHHADLTGDGSDAWWNGQWQFALQYIEAGMIAASRRLM